MVTSNRNLFLSRSSYGYLSRAKSRATMERQKVSSDNGKTKGI